MTDRRPDRPSRLVRILLRLLCPREIREEFEGDLIELRARRTADRGSTHAHLRLAGDVASLCGRLLGERLRDATEGTKLWPAGFGQDVRYAARLLGRQPRFTVAVVATLALGIGSNAAIFSIVHGVLFKDLPYEAGDRFVAVHQIVSGPRESFTVGFTSRGFATIHSGQSSLEHLAAVTFNDATLAGRGEPEKLQIGFVSPEFFPLLGTRPPLGRPFQPDEYAPGHNDVALISHALWRRRFGGDQAVVSQSMSLDGRSVRIVGVLPPAFEFVEPADVWVPLVVTPSRLASPILDLSVYGRLRPGLATEAASRELTGRLVTAAANRGPQSVRVERVRTLLAKDVRRSLLLFWGAVGLVLLVACANVANLLLARAANRRREIAVCRALGVDGPRLVRQLLVESVMLSLGGGVAGLALAGWGAAVLVGISPATIPRLHEIGIDPTVVGFTIALSAITGLAFGLAPALHAARGDLILALGAATPAAGFAVGRASARHLILILEVAITLVLLVGSGLLVRSFVRLQHVDTGFSPDDVAAVTVSIPITRGFDRPEALHLFQQLRDRVALIPGVRSAAVTSGLPLTRRGGRTSLVLEGRETVPATPPDDPASGAPRMPPPPPPPAGQKQAVVTPMADAIYTNVSDGYFETMGIALVDGRTFTPEDRAGSTPVVIVSETMAKRYWPGERAIGRRLQSGAGGWKTIVGIVGNVRRFRLEAEALPEMYLPIAQLPRIRDYSPEIAGQAWDMVAIARTNDRPADVLPAMRAAVYALKPDQAVTSAITLDQLVATVQAPRRFNMIVLTAFGTAAVLLTMVGLYGVTSYLVAARRREIGIRLALGASRRHITALVVGQSLRLVGIGLVLGLAGSLMLTNIVRGMLFGVQPTDLATFSSVVGLLLVVAGLAAWLPARRAQSIDPIMTLREE